MEQLQLQIQPVCDETVLLRSLIDRAINIRKKQRELIDTIKAQLVKPKKSPVQPNSLTLVTS
jgi:hypothetical protein